MGEEKIGQSQIYDLITSREPSWQQIIYELINSEQLDPWNMDIIVLTNKYFEKIHELEEMNFFISSKILLAASFLLRVKSEILLNKHIKSIDEILFGKKEEKHYVMERIELDEDEIPELFPKTPLPRYKQVTLQELMSALDKAMKTESRRIHKEIEEKQAERLSYVDIPEIRRVNIRMRIRQLYARILTYFKTKKERLPYSDLAKSKDEKIACFLPVLFLSNRGRVWLEQENHFDEIWIWLYRIYKEQRGDELEELREEIEEIEEELDDEQLKRAEKLNKEFENPLADFFDIASEVMKGGI